MQPFIPVQCPFCDAQGQILAPYPGAILVAPCSECEELMLLFAGTTLPLNKDLFLDASDTEQRAHLRHTIVQQLARRIGDVVHPYAGEEDSPTQDAVEPTPRQQEPSVGPDLPTTPITDDEVRDFLAIDLNQIDRKEYFDQIFGSN